MNKSKKNSGQHSVFQSIWKKLTAKIPENVLTTIIMLTVGAVVLCVLFLPQRIEDYQCKKFAAPLFNHFLPKASYAVQTSSVRDDNGGTTAAIILGTEDDLSEEILFNFYSDGEYIPARKGEVVELSVKELDDASIDVLKKAGSYREGDEYYFVYIYSSQPD